MFSPVGLAAALKRKPTVRTPSHMRNNMPEKQACREEAEERSWLCKTLRPLHAPMEPLFGGKLSSTTLTSWR
jgi:hypothetical protein